MSKTIYSHNPYFSRWFSAILGSRQACRSLRGHNPYFSRWFSAIGIKYEKKLIWEVVTILILVDGFLQFIFFGGEKI